MLDLNLGTELNRVTLDLKIFPGLNILNILGEEFFCMAEGPVTEGPATEGSVIQADADPETAEPPPKKRCTDCAMVCTNWKDRANRKKVGYTNLFFCKGSFVDPDPTVQILWTRILFRIQTNCKKKNSKKLSIFDKKG